MPRWVCLDVVERHFKPLENDDGIAHFSFFDCGVGDSSRLGVAALWCSYVNERELLAEFGGGPKPEEVRKVFRAYGLSIARRQY